MHPIEQEIAVPLSVPGGLLLRFRPPWLPSVTGDHTIVFLVTMRPSWTSSPLSLLPGTPVSPCAGRRSSQILVDGSAPVTSWKRRRLLLVRVVEAPQTR
jgi:hypothetical protein